MTAKYSAFFVALLCATCNSQVYTGVSSSESPPPAEPSAEVAVKNEFTTQTVYGFLDFTTTLGNTVMVFSPSSAMPGEEKAATTSTTSPSPQPIQTKPVESQKSKLDIKPSKTHKSGASETKSSGKGTKIVVNSVVQQQSTTAQEGKKATSSDKIDAATVTRGPVVSSVVNVQSSDDVAGIKNNLAEPEYDYLSKQPTEIIDETYKVINLRPSSKAPSKPRPSSRKDKDNPTGLVTKLGGTIIKDGLTTVHETSVIGTYINGKYAQVLQSSSRVLNAELPAIPEGKIRPSNPQRILKTIGPHQGKNKPYLEPTPANLDDETTIPNEGFGSSPGPKTIRRHPGGNGRPKFRKFIEEVDGNEAQKARTTGKNRLTTSRPGYKNRSAQTTTTEAPVSRRRTGFRPTQSSLPTLSKLSKIKGDQTTTQTLIPKVKLPRTGRYTYKPSPKPRVAIRKQVIDEPKQEDESRVSSDSVTTEIIQQSQPQERNYEVNVQRKIGQELPFADDELDPSESEDVVSTSVQDQQQPPQQQQQGGPVAPEQLEPQEPILPTETLNVEISTPADFDDIYFEIATIKSPYTFQVGTMRNTRYITVTSTIKKSFATAEPSSAIAPTEPLTENILVNTAAAYETTLPLDSSVATLPAISLESGQATPPLETITETFSTTQTLLKTHLLPVIADGNTTRITLVQTYNIARVVTATKTLPPMEIYQFIPSKTLNEFNSKLDEAGSELHLELDFGEDESDDDDAIAKKVAVPGQSADSDLAAFNKSPTPSKPIKSETATTAVASEPSLTPEQAQQLALFKFFGQQSPQQQQLPQVITTSKPVVVLETVYESQVIPLISGGHTFSKTLSRPIGTVARTTYEYGTSTVAPLLNPQVAQLQPQLFPQQQQQFTITTAPIVTQTMATVSDSRVLKLTFGAKTAYTTLYSTKVVPTEVTTYVTNTIPYAANLPPAFPGFSGYFPQQPVGYPPFPFVG